MRNKFNKALTLLTVAALSVSFVGCSSEGTDAQPDISVSAETSEMPTENTTENTTAHTAEPLKAPANDYSKLFSERDKSPSYTADADIVLNGNAKCIDSSVIIENGTDENAPSAVVTITKAGIYRLTGTLNGQVVVDAKGEKVQLILDNADITCAGSAAIYGKDSDKIFITSAKSSENHLVSTALDGEVDACIYSKDSLTFNGEGIIQIESPADGIHSADDIVATGGSVTVHAGNCGVKGKDYFAACGGAFNITSGGDGIKSTSADDGKGFVYIEGGSFAIDAQQDGIQAESEAVIRGGSFDIISCGGSANSTKKHNDFGDFGGKTPPGGFGGFGDFTPPDGFAPPEGFGGGFQPPENADAMPVAPDAFSDTFIPFDNIPPGNLPKNKDNKVVRNGEAAPAVSMGSAASQLANTASDESADKNSTKGIKSGSAITISGGDISVDSADDSLHSNGALTISGGTVQLSAGDKAVHADSTVKISGGEVEITASYEGIEGEVIDISGGNIELTASDDGLNASDGTPQNGLGTYSKNVQLNISGGYLHVNADGDGLDSNGDLTISGGKVVVGGPVNGANGALDSNNKIIVTGGELIAIGSSGMAEVPDDESTQYTIAYGFDSVQSAGAEVTISCGGDKVSFKSLKSFDHIVYSSPDIAKGQTYTIAVDGSEVETITVDSITTASGKQSTMGGFGKGGFGRGDFQPPTDADGNFSMPEGGFDRGDFQPPTNENGEPEMPEGGRRGKQKDGGRKLPKSGATPDIT